MKYRIEKRTVGGVITYQPQAHLEHPNNSEVCMWCNLIKRDESVIMNGVTVDLGEGMFSITRNNSFQTWDSIPQAQTVIDIFASQDKEPEPIIEYIPYEPKS